MRHLVEGRKLGRTASHRDAMLGNLAMSIFQYERVVTTVPKAKTVRRVVERLITYAKDGTLSTIRHAARTIRDREILRKLLRDIAPFYRDRQGGYVRIIRTRNRPGDNAPLCIIELVGRVAKRVEEGEAGAKAAQKKPARAKKETEAAAGEEGGAGEEGAKPAKKAPRKSAKPAKEKPAKGGESDEKKRGGKPGKGERGKKRGKND
jgi:large subunit ribosomal protein L17